MPTKFPVGTVTDAAAATLEIAKRIKDGELLNDLPLLGNQAVGIAGVVVDKVLGTPETFVPIGASEITLEGAVDHLELVASAGEPKTGAIPSFVTLQAILFVLRSAVPLLPEPYKSALRTLLELVG